MLLFNLDWLEFTYSVPVDDQSDLLADFFDDFPEFEKVQDQLTLLDHGLSWYKCVLRYLDEFMILYHPDRPVLGIHVVIPSHALHTIADLFGFSDVSEFYDCSEFFKLLKSRHCKPTRIDICYDDYDKLFTPDDFDYFRANKRITSVSGNMGFIQSKNREGSTFTIGRRGKGRYLRIYDKNFESNGLIDAIRYEFELKTDWAILIFDRVINKEVFTFKDLLDGFCSISNDIAYDPELDKDLDCDALYQRRKRAGVLDKWDQFLQLCGKLNILEDPISLKLPTKKTHISYSKIHTWLTRQCLRSMYISFLAIGEDRFFDFLMSGRSKLKDSDFELIQKYSNEFEDFAELFDLGN